MSEGKRAGTSALASFNASVDKDSDRNDNDAWTAWDRAASTARHHQQVALLPAAPTEPPPETAKPKRPPKPEPFEHPLILQQSPIWSRAILWTLMGVATTAIAWACLAQLEEAIPAPGKLEPQGAVKDVQVPVNGVVRAVYVKEGQSVQQGDLLLRLDPTTAQAQLASLQQIRVSLTARKSVLPGTNAGASDTRTRLCPSHPSSSA